MNMLPGIGQNRKRARSFVVAVVTLVLAVLISAEMGIRAYLSGNIAMARISMYLIALSFLGLVAAVLARLFLKESAIDHERDRAHGRAARGIMPTLALVAMAKSTAVMILGGVFSALFLWLAVYISPSLLLVDIVFFGGLIGSLFLGGWLVGRIHPSYAQILCVIPTTLTLLLLWLLFLLVPIVEVAKENIEVSMVFYIPSIIGAAAGAQRARVRR